METLFLDSGYIIALEAEDDQHHHSASKHWQLLTKKLPPIVTTTYIFDEVLTFFSSRNRHSKAVEIGNNLIESDLIELIHVDYELFHSGWEFFTQHQDKTFSLTDCVSFVVMKQRKISSALSFDKHFRQAGFEAFSK